MRNPTHGSGNRRRKAKPPPPGDEVASNLEDRIARTRQQQRARRTNDRDDSIGVSDPRYQMPPLENELESNA